MLNFLAWRKAIAIGSCLDAALAVLAVIASQALYADGREPPPPLRSLLAQIRSVVAPLSRPRPLGGDCERLTEAFAREVFG